MKQILFLGGIVFVGAAGWQIGAHLSADALAMAIGVLFGAMAGIPALIVVADSDRRRQAPPAQLPEPTQWRVAEKRQRIDATVTARRIEVKR